MNEASNTELTFDRLVRNALIVAVLLAVPIGGVMLFTIKTENVTVTDTVRIQPGDRLPSTYYATTYIGPVDKDGDVLTFTESSGKNETDRNLPLEADAPLPFDMKNDERLVFERYDEATLVLRHTHKERTTRPKDEQSVDRFTEALNDFLNQ